MKRARVKKMIAIQITRKLLPSDEWREMSKGYKASEREESMRFGESAKNEARVLGEWSGCHTGNGEKVSCSQAEPGQAIKSAVA